MVMDVGMVLLSPLICTQPYRNSAASLFKFVVFYYTFGKLKQFSCNNFIGGRTARVEEDLPENARRIIFTSVWFRAGEPIVNRMWIPSTAYSTLNWLLLLSAVVLLNGCVSFHFIPLLLARALVEGKCDIENG